MQVQINNQNVKENFVFQVIQSKAFKDKETVELVMKWGLENSLTCFSLRFNLKYQDNQIKQFLIDLVNHPNFRYYMNFVILYNQLNYPKQKITDIKFRKLRTSLVSLDIFDRLQQGVIVKDRIKQTFQTQFENIQINDQLRECLLLQQSQHYCLFNQKQRDQLLFRLFTLLTLGGQMCQYQDYITPYLQTSKKAYKHLVMYFTYNRARKDQHTQDIYIDSYCYQIISIPNVYQKEYNPQNVFYVVVNPSYRSVNVVYNRWIRVW